MAGNTLAQDPGRIGGNTLWVEKGLPQGPNERTEEEVEFNQLLKYNEDVSSNGNFIRKGEYP
jgi:hypothetical protein